MVSQEVSSEGLVAQAPAPSARPRASMARWRSRLGAPRGLLARVRYLAWVTWVGCALVCAIGAVVASATPWGYALMAPLTAWYRWGYRRQSFPLIGLLGEFAILAALLPLMADTFVITPIYICALMLRSLYGTWRHVLLVGTMLALAATIGEKIAVDRGLAPASDLGPSILGYFLGQAFPMLLLAGMIHGIVFAVSRYEILVEREQALAVATAQLAIATEFEQVRNVCLRTIRALAASGGGDVTVTLHGDDPRARESTTGSPQDQGQFEITIAAHDTTYGTILVFAPRTLPADIRHSIQSVASTCALALRTITFTDDLRHRAFHDSLTALPNRDMLLQQAELVRDRAIRYASPFVMMMIDLDGFKPVNDRYGHAAGDRLLVVIAERLRRCVRANDTVSRLGGDEFAVVLDVPSEADSARLVAERILASVSEPIDLDGFSVTVGASIGIAIWGGEPDITTVLKRADDAMYEAKAGGRKQFRMSAEATRDAHGSRPVLRG